MNRFKIMWILTNCLRR